MHAGTRPFPDATSFGLPYQSEKKQLQISFLLPATLLELELLTSLVPHTDFRAKLLQVIDNSWVWLHKANPDDYRFLQSKTKPVSQTSSPRHDDDSLDIKHWDDSISHWLQRQTWTYLQTSEILCSVSIMDPAFLASRLPLASFRRSFEITKLHHDNEWKKTWQNGWNPFPYGLTMYCGRLHHLLPALEHEESTTEVTGRGGLEPWRKEFDTLISWKCRMSCQTLWGDSEMIHNDLKPKSPSGI